MTDWPQTAAQRLCEMPDRVFLKPYPPLMRWERYALPCGTARFRLFIDEIASVYYVECASDAERYVDGKRAALYKEGAGVEYVTNPDGYSRRAPACYRGQRKVHAAKGRAEDMALNEWLTERRNRRLDLYTHTPGRSKPVPVHGSAKMVPHEAARRAELHCAFWASAREN